MSRFAVTSVGEMEVVAATFSFFPDAFLQHHRVTIDLNGIDAVSAARRMHAIIREQGDRFGWTANNLPRLHAIAHLGEMLSITDQLLRDIEEDIEAGLPLHTSHRQYVFGQVETISFVVKFASEDCVAAVRAPTRALAHRLQYLAKGARRRFRRFPRARIHNRLVVDRNTINAIRQMAVDLTA